MIQTLAILGSTGSIGTQALDVARLHGMTVTALTANSDVDRLEAQIREFHPQMAALADPAAAATLKIKVADTATQVLSGPAGVQACAACGAQAVLNSIVGIAGLAPTLAAIGAGSTLALANKESLVTGGRLVTAAARAKGVAILPVDSEHSAIFQSLQGCADHAQIKRLLLTASGGPFFGKQRAELVNVTAAQALKHPNWSMGAKITIDSATMMNKGLELIEAAWLFDMPADRIEILVHRQSIVHSLVEFADHSVIAQLGVPDMRIPIQYALTYPDRAPSPAAQLDLLSAGTLTFEAPDEETFPCLALCRQAFTLGGLVPAAANAANEAANAMFRAGRIGFYDIPRAVEQAIALAPTAAEYTAEDVFETDAEIRRQTERLFL
ncbi:MAG: 1-deoxy-D-xylulose-5-phosphate reductoisomerase [Clostridia bacterium]|nr:1-deoxy-D-xylulose-5-phosphate reductoisomerase [Clostridia bacterium]